MGADGELIFQREVKEAGGRGVPMILFLEYEFNYNNYLTGCCACCPVPFRYNASPF